ncbi:MULTISPECIES: endospore germination permease [Paenibacillus]|uniref:GerAB/ArcD/ProY family transporter n=1 Tax=Paenibacillus TaxID=44249 RepID=UPI00038F6283|nr:MULTISPECIES: endospore germination permease [Paenibacillus]CDN44507.1 Spore germination protein XB [Paenibacillus sp. P22]
MKKTNLFGLLPAVMIQILSVGLVNHVLIVPLILHTAKRDSWMCPVIAWIIAVLWVSFPVYGTMKRLNGSLKSMLERVMGRAGSWTLKFPLAVMLFGITLNTLVDTISWSKTTYLPKTPTWVISSAIILIVLYAVGTGLRTIAYASAVLLPFVLLLGDFVMTANLPHKDYSYLKPYLEHGWTPVWYGALLSVCALVELYTLVLYQHHLKKKFKWIHMFVLMTILSLLTLGPLTGAITQFGPVEAEKMRYPAFSQWRLVQIGKFIEHLDFFAIYQWISGAMIRLSLSLFLMADMLSLRSKGKKWGFAIVLLVLLVPLCQAISDNMVLYRKIMMYYFPIAGAAVVAISMIIWLLTVMDARSSDKKTSAAGMPAEGNGGPS